MDTNWKGEKGILNGKGKRDTKRKGKKEYYTERGNGYKLERGKGYTPERGNRTKEQTKTKRKGKKTKTETNKPNKKTIYIKVGYELFFIFNVFTRAL